MINILYYSNTGGDLVANLLKMHNQICNIIENPTEEDWNNVDKKNSFIIYCDLEIQSKLALLKNNWFFEHFDQEKFKNHMFKRYVSSLRDKNNNYIPERIDDFSNGKMPIDIRKQIIKQDAYYAKQIIYNQWDTIFDRVSEQIAVEWNNRRIFVGYLSPININQCKNFDLLNIIETNGQVITDYFELEYNKDSSTIIKKWINENKFDLLHTLI